MIKKRAILKRRIPFSYLLLSVLLILILLAVLAGIWIFLDSSERNIRENSARMREMTRSHIDTSFHMIDTGLKLYDSTYNEEMRSAFGIVIGKYNRSGSDPSQMDLVGLKKQIGGMDIHLINDRCVIEYSSSPADLGLDFAVIYPDFCVYLHRIWYTPGFYPDRVVMEWVKGEMTKFSYMPAPDHRYIVELGLKSENFAKERMDLQFGDVIKEVKGFDPYIEDVKIFQKQKRLMYNISYIPTAEEDAMLDYLLWENRTSQIVRDPEDHKTTFWQVVDLRDPDYAADTSLFTEITYNDALIDQEILKVRIFSAFSALVVLFSGGIVALGISRRVSRPLERMVEDMNAIAGGDLDQPIREVPGYELSTLRDGISRMVDQLKENLRRCEVSERRFSELVQLLPQGIFESDPHGRITFANPIAYHLFGLTGEETESGLNIFDILVPEDRDRARAKFDRILHGEKTEGSEYTGVRKDGSTFPIMVYTAPILKEEEPIGLRGSIVDISRLKMIEKELRKLNEELDHRVRQRTLELEQANEEMEAFVYSISHDLRAPLRAIDGFSSILLGGADKYSEEEKHHLELIRKSVQRMNELIEGLLILSRVGRRELKRGPISTEPLVRDILAELQSRSPAVSRKIEIGQLPPCYADPVMLRQVFENLISNALKFTRDVRVPEIEIGASVEQGRTVYYIRDNGIGFDMRYAEKIFHPFQKLHREGEYEGSGIGLTIVDRIIKRHNGNIWVESAPQRGATFFFTLGDKT